MSSGDRARAVIRESRGIPATPAVRDLLDGFRAYLALGDADHVLFSLAVAVAAHFRGEPLWGLLVGAPSSGKTETLRALDEVADEHLDEITAAGLLSWLGGKKPKPTGLLARRPGRVFATIADLSTVLAMSNRGDRDMLYSLLRRAYDGRVTRDLGNAPEQLRWEGRLTLLAAVTPAVDNYTSHADALGPRWLYFRVPPANDQLRREASRLARKGAIALQDRRAHVRALAGAVLSDSVERAHAVQVSEQLGHRLDNAALVACLGRADVPRDGYGKRQIIGMPTIEEPPRLAGQLDNLARGLLALGLSEAEAGALCRKAALDSMPLARRACLAALAGGELLSQSEVARRAGCDRFVARMALEEFGAIGVATFEGADSDDVEKKPRGPWYLTGPYALLIQRVFTAAEPVAKSVSSSPKPPKQGDANAHFATGAPPADTARA